MSSLSEALNDVIKALSQEANDLGHYMTNTLYSCSRVGLEGICNTARQLLWWCSSPQGGVCLYPLEAVEATMITERTGKE